MDTEITTYLRLGFWHIADLRGYDHIVFLIALTAGYAPHAWRRLLWLVTAFTLGHSVTLALATLNMVRVPNSLTEPFIAATIVLTGLYGMVAARRGDGTAPSLTTRQRTLYAMALGFGLVHGLGFSSALRSVLGAEERMVLPLLAFNVGLEVGQVIIVLAVLATGALACEGLAVPRRRWSIGLALVTTLLGIQMIVTRV